MRTRSQRRGSGDWQVISDAGQTRAGGMVWRAAAARECCVSRHPAANRRRCWRRRVRTSSASTYPRNNSRATRKWRLRDGLALRYRARRHGRPFGVLRRKLRSDFPSRVERVRAGFEAGVARMSSCASAGRRVARRLHESCVFPVRSRRGASVPVNSLRGFVCHTGKPVTRRTPRSSRRSDAHRSNRAMRWRSAIVCRRRSATCWPPDFN